MKLDKKSIGELVVLILSMLVIIMCFIFSAEKNYISFIASLIGIFSVFCFSTGLFYAPIASIIYSLFYIYLAYTQRYYGEIIAFALMIIPMRIASIVSWVKSKKQNDNRNVHSNAISKKEISILSSVMVVVTVGIFFILRAFNTAEIWIGTFSLVTNVIASYLIFRRNKYMFAVQLINDLAQITMWTISVIHFGISYLPTLLAFVSYFILDTYGLINWLVSDHKRKKLAQSEQVLSTSEQASSEN